MRSLVVATALFVLLLAAGAQAAPIITGISPTSGPPGTSVTVTGNNFGPGATGVWFGTTPAAAFSSDSYTQVTAVVPGGITGVVDLRVTGQGNAASAVTPLDQFTVTAPAPPAAAPAPAPAPAPVVATFACQRVPTLVGHTIGGARKILARDTCALTVKLSGPTTGTGLRVARQSIAPGTSLLQGGTITLTIKRLKKS